MTIACSAPAPLDDAPDATRRGRIPGSVRAAVIARDGRVCQLCGGPVVTSSGRRRRTKDIARQLTLDHIRSVSHGGENTVENLRVACRRCNMRRSAGSAA